MTLDTRPTYLFRAGGERAVRAVSARKAARLLARRKARRLFGPQGEAINILALRSYDETSAEFAAVLRPGPGVEVSGKRFARVRFVVRRA